MYRNIIIAVLLTVVAGTLTNCVEPFDLPPGKGEAGFLVVDGFLNTNNGEVNIRLSRATRITEAKTTYETDALVYLEDSESRIFALVALDSGRYLGEASELTPGKQYRLHVKTSNGKAYRSEFVTIKPTPIIESVTWKPEKDGTQIVVDTRDVSNETRYYRWTFEETWEYQSPYISWWTFSDTSAIENRARDEMVNVCFKTVKSHQIYTTSTVGLTDDVVNDFEINFLPVGTEKLSHHYSILVKQYGISKETYEYLEKLKKTSQDLGGLYAPQPSRVTGNIVNVNDPSEVVLGYFDAAQVTEKRLLISYEDIPDHLRVYNPDTFCYTDTLKSSISPKKYVIIDVVRNEFGFAVGFTYAPIECGDCRVKGGTIIKPDFMPKPNW